MHAHNGLLVDVSTSEERYWDWLRFYWGRRAKGDLIVIEHDIVPRGDTFERMAACVQPWCTSPYVCGNKMMVYRSLGLARFSSALMAEIPDAIEQVGTVKLHAGGQDFDTGHEKAWHAIDHRIDHVLGKAGIQPHVHFPGPEHHMEGVGARTVDTRGQFEAIVGKRPEYPQAQDSAQSHTL